jgi:HlyD family secretion protein
MSRLWKAMAAPLLLAATVLLSALSFETRGAVTVRIGEVERRDLVAVVSGSGFVRPRHEVAVSAQLSGRVVELAVEEGARVDAGDLLLRIDPTPYRLAAERARAGLDMRRALLAEARSRLSLEEQEAWRAEQLGQGKRLISAAELEDERTQAAVAAAVADAAEHALRAAEAEVAAAEEALRRTDIRAPQAGRVMKLGIEAGETATVGTPNHPRSRLLTIADPTAMEVRVRVDEVEAQRISPGDAAKVHFAAFPGSISSGRVVRVRRAEERSRAGEGAEADDHPFEAVVTLLDPPGGLRSDMSARAEIRTDARRGVLSVPVLAVVLRDSQGHQRDYPAERRAGSLSFAQQDAARGVTGVFLVDADSVRFAPVGLGIGGGGYFEVERGLDDGQAIVVGSYQTLQRLENGARVRRPRTEQGGRNRGTGLSLR